MDDALGDISLQDSGNEMLSSHTDQCPVCLMSLKEQLLGTPNNCPHVFCFECIQEWAKVRSTQWSLWLQAADLVYALWCAKFPAREPGTRIFL